MEEECGIVQFFLNIWSFLTIDIKSGERSTDLIPVIPQTTIINVLNFYNVYLKMVDQQVIICPG